MASDTLRALYLGYIACLNARDWDRLDAYIDADVTYNGAPLGFTAYRQARQEEYRTIPDLHFDVQMLAADDSTVASRLQFRITPQGAFLGLPVNGRCIAFAEHAFYTYAHGKIAGVWSILDKAAIEAQLAPRG